MRNDYFPIDCHFHDVLLHKTVLRLSVELEYVELGLIKTKTTFFKDVFTNEGEEFLLMGDDEIIRLDQIIRVDDVLRPNNKGGKSGSVDS